MRCDFVIIGCLKHFVKWTFFFLFIQIFASLILTAFIYFVVKSFDFWTLYFHFTFISSSDFSSNTCFMDSAGLVSDSNFDHKEEVSFILEDWLPLMNYFLVLRFHHRVLYSMMIWFYKYQSQVSFDYSDSYCDSSYINAKAQDL